MRRWPALVLVAALLVGGLTLAGDPDGVGDDVGSVDLASLLAVAAPADADDAAWFCGGQTAGDETMADGTVVVANVGDEPAAGHLEVVSDDGERAQRDLEVPPRTTRRVRLAEVLEADWVAAQVQVSGGQVVVEHEVVGPLGRDVAPCQTSAAAEAFVPSGATTRDATLHLAVYNPYLQPAIVDVAFTTSDALVRRPTDFQGIPVPARSLVVLDVTPVVTVVPVAAATVTTRRGRVVVTRIQTYDGQGASTTEEDAAAETHQPEGLAVTPAVPVARTVWSFPVGMRAATVHERVVVRNPTDRQAEVDVEVALDEPERNGTVGPFPLVVPPGEFAVLTMEDTPSVPEGVPHSLVVRSTNGVPVVAERWMDTGGEGATYLGVATSTGSPVAGPRWAFAAGRRAAGDERQRMVVFNPGTTEVEVELLVTGDGEVAPVPGGQATVPPGERWELDLADLDRTRFSLLVEASGPVVAERRLMAVGVDPDGEEEGEQGRGASTALGIPLPPGLRALS